MNYIETGKLDFVIFTLSQLIVGELRWIGNSYKPHSLALVNRVGWTSKEML